MTAPDGAQQVAGQQSLDEVEHTRVQVDFVCPCAFHRPAQIATIFFAVSRRSPIAGTLTGTAIGLLQDALTNQPIGVNGMAKALIGYAAASKRSFS